MKGNHCGLAIHGAHANMTPGYRRAMTCAYMPEGNTVNGTQHILSDAQVAGMQAGDPQNDDNQDPLLCLQKTVPGLLRGQFY